jgi:hypothetical protein
MKDELANKSNQEQRREFIKTATKLSGIVALLGISAESFGVIISAPGVQDQDLDPRMRAIRLLFTEAMDRGEMAEAIDKYRRDAQLNNNQVAALKSITKEELTALRSLRGKLMPLRISELAVMSTGARATGPETGPVPPYGDPIRRAIARGNLQEMKNTAANARKWIADVNSALAQLDSSIKKIGG